MKKLDTVPQRATRGWFQLLWLKDFKVGEIKALDFFGLSLVAFRTQDGTVHVWDAHCPHLGAHLGHGGKLIDGRVRCPFHGWEFTSDGAVAKIPYATRVPSRCTQNTWVTTQQHGMVFVYYPRQDGAKAPLLPDLPGFRSSDWLQPATLSFKMHAHPRDIAENCVDLGHFMGLHGSALPEISVQSDRSLLHIKQKITNSVMGFKVSATLNYEMLEPGYHTLQITDGPVPMYIFSSLIPIDDTRTENKLTVWIGKQAGWLRAISLRPFILRDLKRIYSEDINIWRHKAIWNRPQLCQEDGPILALRKWYEQFVVGEKDARLNLSGSERR